MKKKQKTKNKTKTKKIGNHARGMHIESVRKVSMNNIEISKIMSLNGPGYGLFLHENDDGMPIENANLFEKAGLYENNKITLNNINIHEIDTGIDYYANNNQEIKYNGFNFKSMDLPNWNVEACGIVCWNDASYCDNSISNYQNINVYNLNGFNKCGDYCNINPNLYPDGSNTCLGDLNVNDQSIENNNLQTQYHTPLGTYIVFRNNENNNNEIEFIENKNGNDYITKHIPIIKQQQFINKLQNKLKFNDLTDSNSELNLKNIDLNDSEMTDWKLIAIIMLAVCGIIFIILKYLCHLCYKNTNDKINNDNNNNMSNNDYFVLPMAIDDCTEYDPLLHKIAV